MVLVLSAVVLLTFLLVAFLSRAVSDRRVGTYGKGSAQADLIAKAAWARTLGEITAEIEAGSGPDAVAGEEAVRIYLPTGPEKIIPQRNVAAGPPNLVKASRSDRPFFDFPGGGGTAPLLASPVNTSASPLRGPGIPPERWNAPRLIGEADFAGHFESPDWILVNRNGPEAVDGMTSGLRDPHSPDFVIGRYAYTIYDIGGLLDITVAGNQLPEDINAVRGTLRQASLTVLGIDDAAFLDWRSEESSKDADFVFNPSANGPQVQPGEQTFFSRADLLHYARENPGVIPPGALEFLTIFSRDANAPSFNPDSSWTGTPDGINSPLLSERFNQPVVTRDRQELPAGTPVLFRRFPLHRLALLSDPDADPEDIEYHFGLRRAEPGDNSNPPYRQNWIYTATHEGRIARLSEIAAGQVTFNGQPRHEPNFFEILQAVILSGSLGKDARARNRHPSNFLTPNTHDGAQNVQIMQIGANIIDQYDADDIPTTIGFRFLTADGSQADLEVQGVESLPYINEIVGMPYRPEEEPDTLAGWFLFELWNPHQDARRSPVGVEELRVVATGGRARVRTGHSGRPGGATFNNPLQEITEVASPWYNLSNSAPLPVGNLTMHDYFAEPTAIGSTGPDGVPAPEYAEDQPGIFAGSVDIVQNSGSPYAIPARDGTRDDRLSRFTEAQDNELQRLLNRRLWAEERYEIEAVGGSVSPRAKGPRGERIYTAEGDGYLRFHGSTTHWHVEEQIPNANNRPRRLVIFAKTGNRYADNATILIDHGNRADFELQALVDGQWITIQRIEGMRQPRDTEPDSPRFQREIPDFHNDSTARTHNHFNWDSPLTHISFEPIDPRTHRFGLAANYFSSLNSSTWNRPTAYNGQLNAWQAMLVGGTMSTPGFGVDFWPWAGASDLQRRQRGWAVSADGFPGEAGDRSLTLGFEAAPATYSGLRSFPPLGALVWNHPEQLNNTYAYRYADRDGVIRPGDAFRGGFPMVAGRTEDRPVVLNRPFRSVGELGYVFRDTPWKTLDFASGYSGDAGLLDVFGLDEAPVAAGKLNLNSAREEVLAALLSGTAARLHPWDTTRTDSSDAGISESAARAISAALREEVQAANGNGSGPFQSRSDLVLRFADNPVLDGATIKTEREAAIRALAEAGMVRTWNLFIDLIAQSGRYPPHASSLEDFVVEGERRIWGHVAIDRFTGEVVDAKLEIADE